MLDQCESFISIELRTQLGASWAAVDDACQVKVAPRQPESVFDRHVQVFAHLLFKLAR